MNMPKQQKQMPPNTGLIGETSPAFERAKPSANPEKCRASRVGENNRPDRLDRLDRLNRLNRLSGPSRLGRPSRRSVRAVWGYAGTWPVRALPTRRKNALKLGQKYTKQTASKPLLMCVASYEI